MITITFASLELSSTVTRYTVIDGGFPLDYDGNTYLNDGLVVALDKTVISAELANVTQNITLFLDNDVKNAIQTDTYRNRRAKIFKGEWDPSTSTLSAVRTIYEGLIDTHNTLEDDGTVELIISSLISPLRRPSDNLSLQVLHNQRLRDGVYGTANIYTTDTFLRNAGESFQDFTVGASEYREAVTKPMYVKQAKSIFGNHKRKYVGEELVSAEIQETPGSQLEDPASYQPAKVYGVSGVKSAVIAAWNHDSGLYYTETNYGFNWRGMVDTESVFAMRPDTRFGTIVYLVHAGEIDSLNIYFDGLNGKVQSRDLSLTSGDTSTHFLNDEYTDSSGTVRNNTYAAVEVLWGSNSQAPLQSWIETSNGNIDADFRGIGYVLVGITFEATRDGAVTKIPQIGFQVKQTKTIGITVPSWNETAIAATTGVSYDNTTPYSANSFRINNSFSWLNPEQRILKDGESFKSSFSSSVLTLTPTSTFASDLDTAYGLTASTPFNFNYVDGVADLTIQQGLYLARFKVASIHRNTAGNEYSLYLAGVKEQNGTIDTSQSFDFSIDELARSGSMSVLSSKVENLHPARVMLDYLLDKQAGPGLDENDIDIPSFVECEENASKIPQYVNGFMQGKDTFVEYMQELADTANLTIYQEGDKIKCRFRKPVQSSDVAVTFDVNNASSISLINFRNEDKFNEYLLTVDLQKTSNVRAPRITNFPIEVRDFGYLSEDNSIRSIGEYSSEWLTLFFEETVEEDGTTSTERDETENSEPLDNYNEFARFLMDISRFYEELELITTYDIAKDFTIGTAFDFTHELYGFTGSNIRRYEVVDYSDNHDGTVSIVGQRHSNAIFGLEDDFSNNIFDSSEPTVLPYTANSESAIPSAPDLTAVWEPNSRRIDLSWTEPSSNSFNITHYQVQEKANEETEWTTISEQLVTSDRVFSRAIVERGGIYKYRVRALTPAGMVNAPFSTTQYIRLDLAFGDNKPEQQRVIITGNRSNASVASAVDTTVTIGLPTNFEAAPADASGTGATSNLGNLGVDLDVTSDFLAAATDSASGTTAAGSTTLPGSPSGGSYEIVETFIPASTGTASQTTGTVGTHPLSNGAGDVVIASDFDAAVIGRFPASGTSTSAVSSQALSNGAGTVSVSSNYVAGSNASESGVVTHSGITNSDGTFSTGSGTSSINDIGGYTGVNLALHIDDITGLTAIGSGSQWNTGGTAGANKARVATTSVTPSVANIKLVWDPAVDFFDSQINVASYGSNNDWGAARASDIISSGTVTLGHKYYFDTSTTYKIVHSGSSQSGATNSITCSAGGFTIRETSYAQNLWLAQHLSFTPRPSIPSSTWITITGSNQPTFLDGVYVLLGDDDYSSAGWAVIVAINNVVKLISSGEFFYFTPYLMCISEYQAPTTYNYSITNLATNHSGGSLSVTGGNSNNTSSTASWTVSNLTHQDAIQEYRVTNGSSHVFPRITLTSNGTTVTNNLVNPGETTVIGRSTSAVNWQVAVYKPKGTYTLPNGGGTLTITDTGTGTSYVLSRSAGFTQGDGLIVDGSSEIDSFNDIGNAIKPWSVSLTSIDAGSTTYDLTRAPNFSQEGGLSIDGLIRGNYHSEVEPIKAWSATAGKPITGSTIYSFNPDSAFTSNRELKVGGIIRTSPYPENGAAPRNWSATATKPQSGSTVYTLNRAANFTNGQGWTIDGTPYNTDIVTISDIVEPWSLSVSRPQSGGTTYELAGGPANLGIDLTVGTQVLTESSRSHTFTDADTNRAWSATFDATTFSLEVDPNDVVYVGNSYAITNQAVTKGADEDDTLTEIANAITALDASITWDSTISTNGTTGNREVTIDLGTTSNIGFDISLGGKNSKNPNITDIETLGAGVNFSSYTLTSPDGGSTLNFNGFTIDATVADRNTVINEAVRQVDVNAEAPKDFLATSDGNTLLFTARTTGTSAGQWNFAWNHGSSTGNLRAKQYETDSDSSSSADNVDAEVVREGVVDGTVNNTSFPSGTYTSTYTDAVRDERNFFAERAVIYSEGNTEPAVSITTNDYTWREILSSG